MATESHPANRTIETSIIINAPIAKVRSLLLDFPSYPSWATWVHTIEPKDVPAGTPLAAGQALTITFHPTEGKPMTIQAEVDFANDNGFAWKGQLLSDWVFGGCHMFLLSEEANGQTKLRHREEFFGALSTPLIAWAGMGPKMQKNYEEFNVSVKAKAEQEGSKL